MIMKKIAIGALLIAACATFFWNCSSETNSVSSCVGSACVEFPEIADFTVTDSCYWLQGESNILIYKDGRVTDQNGNDIGTFDLAEGTIVMDNGSTISDISLNDLTLLTPEMVQQAKEAAKEKPQDEPEENPTENTSSNSHEQPSPDGNSSNSNNGENSNQGNNDGNNSSSSNGSSPVPSSSSKEEEVVDASGYPIASYGKLTENDQGVTKGFATRYWDACKPHCSWPEKVNPNANPYRIARNCNINGEEIPAFTKSEDGTWLKGTVSACDNGGFAYTCIDMIPVAVNDTLAYAFGAAPGVDEKTTCGKCYQIQFTGEGKYGTKEAHGLIARKTLIIMSSNVGHDVTGGQFDIMIPGGGVEEGENYAQCCEREVLEETGFKVRATEEYLEIEELFLDWRHINHYFVCEYVEDTGKQNLTEGEKEAGYEAVWVPLDEAVDMFSKYEDFHQTAIEDYGLYKREYIALKEYAE